MDGQIQEIANIPKGEYSNRGTSSKATFWLYLEFLREGTAFLNRCTKRTLKLMFPH